jgi:phage shock protein E
MTRRFAALLTGLLAFTWLGCDGGPVSDTITPRELAGRLAGDDRPVILDVRTVEEFEGGHIPGAVNIPHTELSARIGELSDARTDELVVHCESGRRAAAAEAVLAEAGFARVRDLEGHMGAWRDADYPVE